MRKLEKPDKNARTIVAKQTNLDLIGKLEVWRFLVPGLYILLAVQEVRTGSVHFPVCPKV